MATDQSTAVSAPVEYRDIAGFPGYRIGSDGSVWSCREKVTVRSATGFNGTRSVMGKKWRLMRTGPDDAGRPKVGLMRDGRQWNRRVCRLVAEAFLGPCPEGLECCHNDGNPANNAVGNLRWDTHKANAADTVAHGTSQRGTRHVLAKLTEEQVREIRRTYTPGHPVYGGTALAKKFGVYKTLITKVVKRRAWAWLPDAA